MVTTLVSLSVAGFLNCGAGAADGASRSFGLVFATEVETGCESSPVIAGKLPEDVDWLVARLLDPEGKETSVLVIDGGGLDVPGESLMTGVLPGRYRLEVTGCRQSGGGLATWGGMSREFDVLESQKSAPIVFMKRAGGLSCVGGKNLNPLAPQFDGDGFFVYGVSAFAAGTVTQGGRIFVSGGFTEDKPKAAGDSLSAGTRVWEYDASQGVFVGIFDAGLNRLELAEPRALHGLVGAPGNDTRLLAVGGVRSAVLVPKGFPDHLAPLDEAVGVDNVVEVLDVAGASATGVQTPWDGIQSTWAVSRDGNWIALAGGRDATAGLPSSDVAFLETHAERLIQGSATYLAGTLGSPRFGSASLFLSTGEMLLIGGWDGTQPAPPELVRPDGTQTLATRVLSAAGPPAGTSPTAFPSLAILKDDGQEADVLVVGGNPLDDPSFVFANPDPTRPTTWVLQLESTDGLRYDGATARSVAMESGSEWAVRSLASLVPLGSSWLMAGGYRAFKEQIDVPGCGLVWGYFCFPRSLPLFRLDSTGTALEMVREVEDVQSRLGALVLPLDEGSAMVLGGMDGFGFPKQDGSGSPPPPATTPILSTGYVQVLDGYFDSDICVQHVPLTR